jgi:hypothetical protein
METASGVISKYPDNKVVVCKSVYLYDFWQVLETLTEGLIPFRDLISAVKKLYAKMLVA